MLRDSRPKLDTSPMTYSPVYEVKATQNARGVYTFKLYLGAQILGFFSSRCDAEDAKATRLVRDNLIALETR